MKAQLTGKRPELLSANGSGKPKGSQHPGFLGNWTFPLSKERGGEIDSSTEKIESRADGLRYSARGSMQGLGRAGQVLREIVAMKVVCWASHAWIVCCAAIDVRSSKRRRMTEDDAQKRNCSGKWTVESFE